jgi:hypothetical protein
MFIEILEREGISDEAEMERLRRGFAALVMKTYPVGCLHHIAEARAVRSAMLGLGGRGACGIESWNAASGKRLEAVERLTTGAAFNRALAFGRREAMTPYARF